MQIENIVPLFCIVNYQCDLIRTQFSFAPKKYEGINKQNENTQTPYKVHSIQL